MIFLYLLMLIILFFRFLHFLFHRLTEKFVLLHHHIYKFDIKYKIYSMKPSERYRSKMFNWVYSSKQRGLMLNDICPYDFTVINQN